MEQIMQNTFCIDQLVYHFTKPIVVPCACHLSIGSQLDLGFAYYAPISLGITLHPCHGTKNHDPGMLKPMQQPHISEKQNWTTQQTSLLPTSNRSSYLRQFTSLRHFIYSNPLALTPFLVELLKLVLWRLHLLVFISKRFYTGNN